MKGEGEERSVPSAVAPGDKRCAHNGLPERMAHAGRLRGETSGVATAFSGHTAHAAGLQLSLLASVLLAGCATAVKTPSEAIRPGGYYQDDGPGESPPPDLKSIPDAQPKDEPLHRYANLPYEMFGRRYVPDTSGKPYKERGTASWYGRKFHSRKTSSGEPYDMYAMSAAHRTLPIPSYARVTRVETGQSVVVRINDRGPFHSNRLIDLSYTAAQKLGLTGSGSALVEVERVFPAGAREGILAGEPRPAGVAGPESGGAPAAGLFVQLGAFASRSGAEGFRDRVKRDLGWVSEALQILLRYGLYRVGLGPYATRGEAAAIADRVRETANLVPLISVLP